MNADITSTSNLLQSTNFDDSFDVNVLEAVVRIEDALEKETATDVINELQIEEAEDEIENTPPRLRESDVGRSRRKRLGVRTGCVTPSRKGKPSRVGESTASTSSGPTVPQVVLSACDTDSKKTLTSPSVPVTGQRTKASWPSDERRSIVSPACNLMPTHAAYSVLVDSSDAREDKQRDKHQSPGNNPNNTHNNTSTKSVSFVFTQGKQELSTWGLPEPVLEAYRSAGITRMFPWQVECLGYGRVLQGGNLVYSAPTSAGKTMVAEILILKRVLEAKKKAIVILPFVSVAREKMISLQMMYENVGIRVEGFMGNYSPPGGLKRVDVAICTIEKANSLINRLLEEGELDQLGILVVDELHLVGDSNRGYLLELLLTKILYMSTGRRSESLDLQVVGMSATLPNLNILAKWLKADLYHTDFRPVPLTECVKVGTAIYDKTLVKIRQLDFCREIVNDADNLIELCLETVVGGHSVLVFCPAKAWCERLAENIGREFFNIGSGARPVSNRFIKEKLCHNLKAGDLEDVLKQLSGTTAGLDRTLNKSVRFGVAFHHAGLTFDERDVIESSFRRGVIKVLVATSTLSSGVNLPARRVIVRSPLANGQMMDVLTYKQMVGRAGRKGVDTEGESILLCKESEKGAACILMTAELPPVRSCLVKPGQSLSGSLKRALLEVVASEVATTLEEVQYYASCTLLASSMTEQKEVDSAPINSCIKFLKDNEFLRLQEITTEEGETKVRYVATQLGKATLASALSPDESLIVFAELEKARKNFVLENELHLLYQVTPTYVASQLPPIDWLAYLSLWENLPPGQKRVGELVGVDERFIVRAVRGVVNYSVPKQAQHLAIHKRFYTTLALNDLVNEVPLQKVSDKYGCNKGLLQNLQQQAATFAGMVTVFCSRLGWNNLQLLLNQFGSRLHFGVQRELVDLVKLEGVSASLARHLYDNGITCLTELAAKKSEDLENVLRNSTPFVRRRSHSGENEEQKECKAWKIGNDCLTVGDAAKTLVRSARELVKKELGVKNLLWGSQMNDSQSSTVSEFNNYGRRSLNSSGEVHQRLNKSKNKNKRKKNLGIVSYCRGRSRMNGLKQSFRVMHKPQELVAKSQQHNEHERVIDVDAEAYRMAAEDEAARENVPEERVSLQPSYVSTQGGGLDGLMEELRSQAEDASSLVAPEESQAETSKKRDTGTKYSSHSHSQKRDNSQKEDEIRESPRNRGKAMESFHNVTLAMEDFQSVGSTMESFQNEDRVMDNFQNPDGASSDSHEENIENCSSSIRIGRSGNSENAKIRNNNPKKEDKFKGKLRMEDIPRNISKNFEVPKHIAPECFKEMNLSEESEFRTNCKNDGLYPVQDNVDPYDDTFGDALELFINNLDGNVTLGNLRKSPDGVIRKREATGGNNISGAGPTSGPVTKTPSTNKACIYPGSIRKSEQFELPLSQSLFEDSFVLGTQMMDILDKDHKGKKTPQPYGNTSPAHAGNYSINRTGSSKLHSSSRKRSIVNVDLDKIKEVVCRRNGSVFGTPKTKSMLEKGKEGSGEDSVEVVELPKEINVVDADVSLASCESLIEGDTRNKAGNENKSLSSENDTLLSDSFLERAMCAHEDGATNANRKTLEDVEDEKTLKRCCKDGNDAFMRDSVLEKAMGAYKDSSLEGKYEENKRNSIDRKACIEENYETIGDSVLERAMCAYEADSSEQKCKELEAVGIRQTGNDKEERYKGLGNIPEKSPLETVVIRQTCNDKEERYKGLGTVPEKSPLETVANVLSSSKSILDTSTIDYSPGVFEMLDFMEANVNTSKFAVGKFSQNCSTPICRRSSRNDLERKSGNVEENRSVRNNRFVKRNLCYLATTPIPPIYDKRKRDTNIICTEVNGDVATSMTRSPEVEENVSDDLIQATPGAVTPKRIFEPRLAPTQKLKPEIDSGSPPKKSRLSNDFIETTPPTNVRRSTKKVRRKKSKKRDNMRKEVIKQSAPCSLPVSKIVLEVGSPKNYETLSLPTPSSSAKEQSISDFISTSLVETSNTLTTQARKINPLTKASQRPNTRQKIVSTLKPPLNVTLLSRSSRSNSMTMSLTGGSFTIIDVASNIELWDTFCVELKSKDKFAFSLACEQRPDDGKKTAIGSMIKNRKKKKTEHGSSIEKSGIAVEGQDVLIVGFAVSWTDRDAYYVCLQEKDTATKDNDNTLAPVSLDGSIDTAARLEFLRSLLENDSGKQVTVVMMDAKEQCKLLARDCGVLLERSIVLQDPKVASWVLDPASKEKNLHNLVVTFSTEDSPILDNIGATHGTCSIGINARNTGTGRLRACVETVLTQRVMPQIKLKLEEASMWTAFEDVEMPAIMSLTWMELTGMGFAADEAEAQKDVLQAKLTALEEEAYSLAGHSFSLTSPDQVSAVVYNELHIGEKAMQGARRVGLSATKKLPGSTSKEALEKLKPFHPLPAVILEWRRINCLITKNVFPLTKEKVYSQTFKMDRIYSESSVYTMTGRVTMADPNLQNIPKDFEIMLDDKLRKSVSWSTRRRLQAKPPSKRLKEIMDSHPSSYSVSMRHAFLPFKGGVILAADYSQLELRVLAHLSKDEKLCEVLNRGGDVFNIIAAKWKRIKEEEVTPAVRQQAKQVCYGMIYGIGERSLAEQLGIKEMKARTFMESFRNRFPDVKKYIIEITQKCKKNGFVETVMGRRRYLPGITSQNPHARAQAERQAVNTSIQGSAADLVKMAMVKIDKGLLEQFPDCLEPLKGGGSIGTLRGGRLVLQLHDELIYEVHEEDVITVARLVKMHMEGVLDLLVPLPAKIKAGPSWGTLGDLNL